MSGPLQTLGPPLIGAGFQIVAIHPGRKNPMGGKGWQEHPLTTETLPRYNGAGVGLLASVGGIPIRPVDIDCSWPEGLREAVRLAFKILGPTVQRVGEWPKQTLFYRAAEGGWPKGFSARFTHPAHLTKRTRDSLDGEWVEKPNVLNIEFLGKGNQSILYGIHPCTGRPFEWLDFNGGLAYTPPEELPVITLEQEAEFREAWEQFMRSHPEVSEPNPPWAKTARQGYLPPNLGGGIAVSPATSGGPARKKPETSEILDISELPVRRAQLPLEQAAEMLAATHPETGARLFDPNCQRKDWLDVGMALHHGYNGSQEALDVWIDWSSGWSAWGGEARESCVYQWHNGMRKDLVDGRPAITMGSVIKKYRDAFPEEAEEARQEAALKTAESALEEFLHKVSLTTSRQDLLDSVCLVDGPRLVDQALPSALSEAVDAVMSRLKEVGGLKGTTRNDVKKILCRKQKPENKGVKATQSEEDFLNGWERSPEELKGWAWEMKGNQFVDTSSGLTYSKDAFDGEFAFLALKLEVARMSDWVHTFRAIPHAHRTLYMPGANPLFTLDGDRIVNSWNRRNFAKIPPDLSDPADAGAARLFKRHLAAICGGWNRDAHIAANFIKHAIFRPGKKIRWAMLIQGLPGSGKSLFEVFFRRAIGARHVNVVDNTIVKKTAETGQNGWAGDRQVGVLNEVRATGHSRHDILNALKPLVTDDTLSSRKLYREQEVVPNVTNWLLLTNYRDCLPLDGTDRRYFVLWSRFPMGELSVTEPDYFTNLFGAIENNLGGILRWLMDLGYHAEFMPNGHAPMTEAKKAMIGLSGDDRVEAVRETLETSGSWAVKPDLLLSGHLRAAAGMPGVNGTGGVLLSDADCRYALEKLGYLKLGFFNKETPYGRIKGTAWSKDDLGKEDAIGMLARRLELSLMARMVEEDDGSF